jgi:hypothetical protein
VKLQTFLQMDNVINLFLPFELHVNVPDYKIDRDEDKESYIYEGKPFIDITEATIATGVFGYITDGVDNMTLPEVESTIHHIINMDELLWDQNKTVYDLDVPLNDRFVPLADFQTSCPHHPIHPRRYTDGKWVSCHLSKLDFYTRIISWRQSYLSNRDGQPPFLPNIVLPFSRLEEEIIIAASKFDEDKPHLHIFNTYQVGIDHKINENTLTRNRLYYDFLDDKWTTKDIILRNHGHFFIDLDLHFNLFFKSVKRIISLVQNKEPVEYDILAQLSMMSLFGSDAPEKKDNLTVDIVETTLKNYYIHFDRWQSHVFDLSILDWRPSSQNEIPQITGKNHNLLPSIFVEMVSRINAINQVIHKID